VGPPSAPPIVCVFKIRFPPLGQDSEPITALAVSPDCRTVVAASRSSTCRVYNMVTGAVVSVGPGVSVLRRVREVSRVWMPPPTCFCSFPPRGRWTGDDASPLAAHGAHCHACCWCIVAVVLQTYRPQSVHGTHDNFTLNPEP